MMQADPHDDNHDDHDHDTGDVSFWRIRNVQLAAIAGVLLAVGIAADQVAQQTFVAELAFFGAIFAGGATFVWESVRGAVRGHVGVGTLMTTAAVGAVLLGEFAEAASLAFLFSIAEGLESYSLTQAKRGLRALLSLVPDTATVIRTGEPAVVPAGEVEVGDVLLLRPGERLATDGVVSSGRSSLEVSAITGESVRVEVNRGVKVLAGSINGGGALEIDVTATAENNSLARIVHIVEEAQERKGHNQRLADRIAQPLVPGIMVVAAAAAILGSLLDDPSVWLPRSLVILVAAAPCAFAIAVPVTVVAAIGAASRSGALVKGGAAMEMMGSVRVVALDKTGTLTRNRPQVIGIYPLDGVTSAELLGLAAALEAQSEHPLAPAILAAAPPPAKATNVEAVAGQGLTGTVDGAAIRLGRPGFVSVDRLATRLAEVQGQGATAVLIGREGRTLGLIAVRDELRDEAPEVVRQLRALRVETIMLTGDNRQTAEALAAAAGIDRVEAELRPEDKAEIIEQLKSRGRVAMVGDGINDAPALASADVGIAMGAMGTDVAIETADVALMGEDLRHLPALLEHSRRALGIMRQNLVLSGAILVALVPLAALGVLGLAAVVAIHEIAEVIVIANGLRAGWHPPSLPAQTLPAAT